MQIIVISCFSWFPLYCLFQNIFKSNYCNWVTMVGMGTILNRTAVPAGKLVVGRRRGGRRVHLREGQRGRPEAGRSVPVAGQDRRRGDCACAQIRKVRSLEIGKCEMFWFLIRGSQKSQAIQCLGFCTAEFWSSLVYESAVQNPKAQTFPNLRLLTLPLILKKFISNIMTGLTLSDAPAPRCSSAARTRRAEIAPPAPRGSDPPSRDSSPETIQGESINMTTGWSIWSRNAV